MKLSKLFGKFFIALIVPSLLLSSCALLGLEEEEEEETTTAAATPTVDTSSADPMTFGSYSYTSITGACYSTALEEGGTVYYLQDTFFRTGTVLNKHITVSTDANCSVSAGSTVTIAGTSYPNPLPDTDPSISINSGSIGSYGSGNSVTDADGNSITSGFYIVSGLGSNGSAKVAIIVYPKSASKAHGAAPGDTCRDNSGSSLTDTSQCTLIQNSYTLIEVGVN